MQQPKQIIFTSQANAAGAALQEIQGLHAQASLLEWLEPGIGRAVCSLDWRQLSDRLADAAPIFVRHLHPVHHHVYLSGLRADLDILAGELQPVLPLVDTARSFSVQTRLVGRGERDYGAFDVNTRLAQILQSHGATLDVRRPEQVLSVVCSQERGYLGFSPAAENLGSWAGGVRRFKRRPEQISRAEFKLLEALELFALRLPAQGQVLDLGAAPGGWSRIMLERGLRVTAVDPAALDSRLAGHPGLEHIRKRIQDFDPGHRRYEVILNDMRMQPGESIRTMRIANKWLRSGGLAILTLKLTAGGYHLAEVRAWLAELGQTYAIMAARQLFHNRNEVTVALGAAARQTNSPGGG